MKRFSSPARAGVITALTAAVAGTLCSFALSPAGAATNPTVQHPSKLLTRIVLDYQTALKEPDGMDASLPGLEQAVEPAAEADFAYLRYETRGDLGGFEPAPRGRFVSLTTGRAVGNGPSVANIPLLARAGKDTTVFGLRPGAPSTTLPPTTTTTIPSTSTTVPTIPTTTRPPPSLYLKMRNNHGSQALLDATNMAPGDTASRTVTLSNVGTIPFTLSLQTAGSSNALARLLTLRVVAVVSGNVLYHGSLNASGVRIANLAVNQSIELVVSLHLPRDAGNSLQNQTVKLNLFWNGES